MNIHGNHIPGEDLTLYALHALDAEEAARVREHVARCGDCRNEVAQVNSDLAHLALSPEQVKPSPGARQRFLARLEQEASRPAITSAANVTSISATRSAESRLASTETATPSRPGRSPWWVWAALAAMVLIAVGAVLDNVLLRYRLNEQAHEIAQSAASTQRAQDILSVLTAPDAQRVTLTSANTKPQPTGHASYLKSRAQLVFTASNLQPLPSGKVYELWLIPTSGAPVPAGTFSPDVQGSASVLLPQLPQGLQAKAFGVTMENEGGALTPTAPILLAGS